MRVEDGSLNELADVFLEIIRPYAVPAGTVVLLHSISHLAWVGAAAYAEDLVRCCQRIFGVYRSGISVIHRVPVLLGGSNLRPLSSDLNIVLDWYSSTRHTAERDIVDTRKIIHNLISAASPMAAVDRGEPMAPRLNNSLTAPTSNDSNGGGQPMALPPVSHPSGQPMAPFNPVISGSGQPMALLTSAKGPSGSPMALLSCPPMAQGTTLLNIRLRLPASLDSMKPDVFEATIRQDLCLPVLDEGHERVIVETLVGELNCKFHVGLDPNFSTAREPGYEESEQDSQGDNYIVVGSSHASRLVEALRAIGESVTSLADPKWRLTEDSAKVLAAQLKSAVAANRQRRSFSGYSTAVSSTRARLLARDLCHGGGLTAFFMFQDS